MKSSTTSSGRDDAVDEPDLKRFGRIDASPGQHEVLGARGADEPGQSLGAAATRYQAQGHLWLPQHGVRRRDPHVRDESELAPTAEREPGDGRDDRLAQRGQLAEAVLQAIWSRR